MLYNAFFTSWPCLFTTSFEQDTSVDNSYRYPALYLAGKHHTYFNARIFWRWILLALWHGLVSFYVPTFGFSGPSLEERTLGHWGISTIAFSVVVHTVTAKLFVESEYWHWISALSAGLSLLLYHLVLVGGSTIALADVFQPEAAGVTGFLYGSF